MTKVAACRNSICIFFWSATGVSVFMINTSMLCTTKSISILGLFLLSFFVSNVWASGPQALSGHWYQAIDKHLPYHGQEQLNKSALKAVPGISLFGGEYWFQGDLKITKPGRYVLDFKNTNNIGLFHHYLYDQSRHLVAEFEGGIESDVNNPFFLRHGREVELQAGRYHLLSHISSPYYLAQPALFVDDISNYRTNIRASNTLSLVCLGGFLFLGIYYAALSLSRRRMVEAMYTIFILGNLLFGATSLLILPQLFGIHWFYLGSVPILFSNMAYIGFVMALLSLRRETHPRLFVIGISILVIMAAFIVLAFINPHWSMEYARYGVGLFLTYGLISGLLRAYQGYVAARLYLVAISTFFVLGGISISVSKLSGVYNYQIEHLGVFAVSIEVILLALVLSYQFAQLQREKDSISIDYALERERHEELVAAKSEAERANKAKSQFLSSMSHELRTPMNAILGFAQLMNIDETLPEKFSRGVKEILRAGNHLLDLINDVLDLAKVESGRIQVSLETVELQIIVKECLELVRPLTDEKQIYLVCANLEGIFVKVDRTRFKQAFLNLLSNAIKYNHDGGKVEIGISKKDDNKIRIMVSDTGPGIAKEYQADLFQPFNRLDAENSDIEGTGIGLALTKTIVELMNGQIGFESEVGKGSCFWIELPKAEQIDLKVSLPDIQEENPFFQNAHAGQYTVLYIEDNPANVKLMEDIIDKRKHIELIIARTPQLGLEMAALHLPTIILLDINLPGMDGYQVLKKLRQDNKTKEIPVVAVSANAMARDIKRGIGAGFIEYLAKPLDVEKFWNLLDRLLILEAERA